MAIINGAVYYSMCKYMISVPNLFAGYEFCGKNSKFEEYSQINHDNSIFNSLFFLNVLKKWGFMVAVKIGSKQNGVYL